MHARITKVKPLKSFSNVVSVLEYCYDEKLKHPSHAGYQIVADQKKDPHAFAATIERALATLNREASPSHQISTRAYWIISRVPDHSNLTDKEWDAIQSSLVQATCPAWHRWARHIDLINGAGDLNIIAPSVTFDDGLPRLRRWVGSSLWCQAKSAADEVFEKINGDRTSSGRSPIPGMSTVQRLRADEHGGSIEMRLAHSSTETRTPVTVANLPKLMDHAGFERSDWSIEEDELFWIRAKRKLRIKLDALIAAANALKEQVRSTHKTIAVLPTPKTNSAQNNMMSSRQAPDPCPIPLIKQPAALRMATHQVLKPEITTISSATPRIESASRDILPSRDRMPPPESPPGL